MSAPDRIYIHTGDCDDTYYELSDCCDDEVDYIRTDIHEAEITALKAELAALKAPPKVLSAEEVEEEGWYWSVDNEEFVQIDCDPTILPWQLSMWRVSSSVCSRLQGQFIGPIQMPGV